MCAPVSSVSECSAIALVRSEVGVGSLSIVLFAPMLCLCGIVGDAYSLGDGSHSMLWRYMGLHICTCTECSAIAVVRSGAGVGLSSTVL